MNEMILSDNQKIDAISLAVEVTRNPTDSRNVLRLMVDAMMLGAELTESPIPNSKEDSTP